MGCTEHQLTLQASSTYRSTKALNAKKGGWPDEEMALWMRSMQTTCTHKLRCRPALHSSFTSCSLQMLETKGMGLFYIPHLCSAHRSAKSNYSVGMDSRANGSLRCQSRASCRTRTSAEDGDSFSLYCNISQALSERPRHGNAPHAQYHAGCYTSLVFNRHHICWSSP